MKLIATTAIATLIAGAALAGSPVTPVYVEPVVAPMAAATSDWGGFYVGGMASFDSGTYDILDSDVITSSFDLTLATTYGAFAGYNWQNGSWVLGGEIAYSAAGTALSTIPASNFTYIADAKARVGKAFDNFLLYGFGGMSMANFDDSGLSIDHSGFNYGIGGEVLATEDLFIGIEFLMRDMSADVPSISPVRTNDSFIQSIQIRAGWNF